MSKVWRAFPELDRFDDERCARFVKAAKRRWWLVAVVQGLAAFLAWLLLAVPATILARWLSNTVSQKLVLGDVGFMGVSAVVMSLAMGLAFVPMLLLKDWRLRRRIAMLIAARGSCGGCGYGLLGLPVPESLRVTCPECGRETVVDAALGELVSDERGRALFQAGEDVGELPTWFTPGRRRWITRSIVAVVLVVGLAGGGWWGWQTLARRMDAEAARADRAQLVGGTEAALIELVARGQPEFGPGERDGWVIMQALGEAEGEATLRAINVMAPGLPKTQVLVPWSDGRFVIDFGELTQAEPQEERGRLRWRANREAARVVAGLIGSTAVPGLMRELIGFRRAVGGLEVPAGEPVFRGSYDKLIQARRLARFTGGLMDMALERGDRAAWLESFEACLALGRLIRLHPMATGQMVGPSIEALADARVRAALERGVDAAWLEGVERAMDRQESPSSGRWLEAARLEALDTLVWAFEDVEKIAEGLGIDPRMPGRRLGRYAENRESLEAFYRAVSAYSALSAAERAKATEPITGGLLLSFVWQDWARSVLAQERQEGNRSLLRVTIAAERFRLAKGRAPMAMGELVPEYLAKLPVDVVTGAKLKIRAVDAKLDISGRGYVIELEPEGGGSAKPGE